MFLRLFCEGLNKAGYTKIPDGFQGISSIINFFISNVNSALAKPNRLYFPDNLNIIKKNIDALISYKINNNLRYVTFEKAFEITHKISQDYGVKKGLLDELISEGILSKNLFWQENNQYEEGIYLTYERFEDHIIASLLIKEQNNLDKAFQEGGNLHYLVENEHKCYLNKGIVEALTIQVPEKTGKEFYEFVPHVKDSCPIIECFVQSLLWRKTETMSEKLVGYVNSTVLSYKGTHDLFWDTLLSVTSMPDHYFNAYSLHKNLARLSLEDRDES